MPEPIPLLEAKKTPTLLEAAFANKLIKLINSLSLLAVSPAGAGKLVVTEQNTVLDLSPLVQKLDAVALAVQQSTPPQLTDILNRLENLENVVTTIGDQITTINNRLAAASGTGTVTCNPDGSFTVTITITI